MTRNRFFCYIVACTLVLSLTGCGSATPAAPAQVSSGEVEEVKSFEGEGPVQGGIKSDEEIAALQKEEQQYASEAASEEEPAEFVDNTGHEPDSYGSGNFQDYWQGDDYFDIVAYAKANGCNQISYLDASGSPVKDEYTAGFYTFYFGDWMIQPYGNGCNLTYLGNTDADGYSTCSPEYNILPESLDEQANSPSISVSKNNDVTIPLLEITFFDTVVNALKANSSSQDPLSETNLNYTQMR